MDSRLGREQSLWVLGLIRACTQEGGGGGSITAAATTEAAAAVATEAYGSVLIGQTFAVGEEAWGGTVAMDGLLGATNRSVSSS
jgi:hypothetical protein